jgi:hypothetical protein
MRQHQMVLVRGRDENMWRSWVSLIVLSDASVNTRKYFPLLDAFGRFSTLFGLHAITHAFTSLKVLKSQKVHVIYKLFSGFAHF